MNFFEKKSNLKANLNAGRLFLLLLVVIVVSLLNASYVNARVIGYVSINPNQWNNVIDYSVSSSSTQATSAKFCDLADNLFNNNGCGDKTWGECDFWDFQMKDYVYFENINDNEVGLTCSQRGLFDGCSGSSAFYPTIKLCDSSYENCVANSGEIVIDLKKVGLSKKCTRLGASTSGDECSPDDTLKLYTKNNYEVCAETPEGADYELRCISGKCARYQCINDNYQLDPYEPCDPGVQKFNVGGEIKTADEITCLDFDMYPNSEGERPICGNDCKPDLSMCTSQPSLCPDYKIEKYNVLDYVEKCDLAKTPESYVHPDGTKKTKQHIFSSKAFCAQQEGYIGDASYLECEGCTEISYDACPTVQLTKQKEQNCGNGLNDDYWYDLYIEGDNRTKYIAENYLDEQGYFENYKFDTSRCFSETNCSDCYDIDCDGKVTYDGKYCNFKTERMCNDNFDNDGDGLIDEQDSDCSFERYNPHLSLKGLCDAEEKCFDESELECINDSEVFVKDKTFVCKDGNWINEIKLISALTYDKLKDQQSLILYCNDPADFTNQRGYVIDIMNTKTATGMNTFDFMSSQRALYGKFCAAKTDDYYLIGTVLKSKEAISNAVLLFNSNGTICDEITNNDNILHQCKNTQVFLNYKTGILLKTNIFNDGAQLFNGINEINTKIEELKSAGEPYLGYNSLQDLEKSGEIEAFALKKSGEKELLGIIAKVNSTWYAIVYIKNVPSFTEVCDTMNEKATLTIVDTPIKCQEINNNFVIAWRIADESVLEESKYKFDKLVKELKL